LTHVKNIVAEEVNPASTAGYTTQINTRRHDNRLLSGNRGYNQSRRADSASCQLPCAESGRMGREFPSFEHPAAECRGL